MADAAVLEEPLWLPGGFSACLPRVRAPRLVLEMGTTRLMSWFSEFVRVRTGLYLLVADTMFGVAGFIPAGRVLEAGGFLVDGLDKVTSCAFG